MHFVFRQNHATLLPFVSLQFKYRLALWNNVCIQIIWQRLGDSSPEFMMVHVLSSGLRWSLWNELLQKHNWNVFRFGLTRWIALSDLCAVVLRAGVAQREGLYVCACVFLEGGEEWSECALPEELCGDALPDDLWPQLKKEALTGTVLFCCDTYFPTILCSLDPSATQKAFILLWNTKSQADSVGCLFSCNYKALMKK